MNIISVKNLSFKYEKISILEDINFSVNKGDYVALAGPNGSGKTTLIRTVLGLEKANGEIFLFGKKIKEFNDWGKIGYLPQKASFSTPIFPAKVKEVVSLGLLSSKKHPKRINSFDKLKIEETLKILDIFNLKDILINNLSGGQQQRVFLARAIVSDPQMLILDEPSSGLDISSRENFFELLKKINKEKGVAIILITHDASDIGKYANKLLYLDKKILFYGLFSDFCKSKEMEKYFGHFSQHLICHQH
ncbi:MAG: metal ABC transporter ATP-binding protein [Candidatus Paceibacterota bacterium]|nr:metal ABC transporter ATP-binding protein [Candidatus Paceibacterota bacterium]MDD4897399.1 metal ABC transporter ATP-binding protein [Candidatus Paceibacterota bacterium]